MKTASVALKELYETDEVAWLDATVEQIRFGNIEEIDFANLEEFLTAMARSERKETVSRLTQLIAHVLKWIYQPEKRTRSWAVTITVQQQELAEGWSESRSLLRHAEERFETAYERAVRQASKETGMAETDFPTVCPFTLEQALVFDADVTGLAD